MIFQTPDVAATASALCFAAVAELHPSKRRCRALLASAAVLIFAEADARCAQTLSAPATAVAPNAVDQPPAPQSAVASPQAAQTICGQPVPAPAKLPPAGSPPVIYFIAPCFARQGGVSAVDASTYLYYIRTRPSQPSQDIWVPYDDKARAQLLVDFRALWATNFLDNLSIEATDYAFANGVIGKLVTYDIEERQRVKIVDYVGATHLQQTAIDEKLREEQVTLRLDAFLDDGVIRRVKAIIGRMLSEKGLLDSTITHAIKPVAGGVKQVHLTFKIEEGPTFKVRRIEFAGNTAIGDRALKRKMKATREPWLLSRFTGRGTYKEHKYAEDAEQVVAYYRDQGYLRARVDNPQVRTIGDSADRKTRFIELRIAVSEGPRYRVGDVTIADNTIVKSEALLAIFKLAKGEHYAEKKIRKGLERARELYGSVGYFEFTAYPEFAFSDLPGSQPAAESLPPQSDGKSGKSVRETGPHVVNITLHMQEGEQYFVNRISFVGNTTTRDNVIRREMRLLESGVFNTEALKYSIKRINQLGFFKPLEGQESVKVEKTPNEKNKVDVTLKVEEQNRNELTFGGGLSGVEGAFVTGSYGTSNFLGQGERVQLSLQVGARSSYYQAAITEPYLFDRHITAGLSLYSRKIDYLMSTGIVGYSEVRTGATATGGVPFGSFARLFGGYTYEVIDTAVHDDLAADGDTSSPAGETAFNPFLDEGRHIESRVSPSLVHNTVDNPLMPRRGIRLSGGVELAGGPLGGTVSYISPTAEVVVYIPHTRRTGLGLRGEAGWIRPYGVTSQLPYYRRFFLGGETQIRGVDIRTVGPLDAQNRALGGNKFVLFNAEYYFDIAGSLRFLLFHDAGQAFDEETLIDLRQLRTSSGVELRFLMPVMNVPFRLIYAWNRYRDAFQPARALKFAVGTTF